MKPSLRSSSLLLPALLLGACSGGGGSSPREEDASARLALGSVGDSGLFSLSVELLEVRLVATDGTPSANLLPAPSRLELVGLDRRAAWLGAASVPPGTYDRLLLVFDDGAVDAMAAGGERVDVSMPSRSSSAPLEDDWVVTAGSADSLLLEIDLSGSILGDARQGAVEFEPDVLAMRGMPMAIEELEGTVRSASAREHSLCLLSGDRVPTGELDVTLTPSTTLIDGDGTAFDGEAGFFASLRPGLTVLSVTGTLESFGELTADVIRIVDQAGGSSEEWVVLEGMVLRIEPANARFLLLIREIEAGAEIARPVLTRLGDPSAIDVHWDDRTRFRGPDGRPLRASDLVRGQIVDVAFRAFRAPPFLADAVEVERRDLCLEGRITSVRGLPERILVAVDDDTHVRDDREVLVDLTHAEVFLDLHRHPRLRRERLQAGMEVRLCGEIGGTRELPVIAAGRVLVVPGRLVHGRVDATAQDRARFVAGAGRIAQSFGAHVTAPPFDVKLAPQAIFRGDASSAAEFFRLFASLEPRHEVLEVDLKGLGTATAEEIEAFELRVAVRKVD